MTNLEFSNSNSKITLSVLSVLLFSFLLVIFFMNTYGSSMEDNKTVFYHQVFDTNEKKIFLIGSSQTHAMILKTDMDYIVLGNYIIDRQG